MVSSRNRSSTTTSTSDTPSSSSSRVPKPPLEEWTIREKLCLASLANKHGNAWSSVARNMQGFIDKSRPDGWSNQNLNQKTCAAQFDKLMAELGVDKRPKRNEPSDGSSGSVIYKKMAEKRIKELEDSITNLRKLWLGVKNDLDALESGSLGSDRSHQLRQKIATPTTSNSGSSNISATPVSSSKSGAKASTLSTVATTATTTTATSTFTTTTTTTATTTATTDTEKPPTRALTRRESSRQNLEKTLASLCRESSEIKAINLMCKPSQESEREFYDKVILKHMDISVIKKRLGSEVDDPHAVLNDLLLMFQNATMFYPPDHPTHKAAVELRDKLVPQWEKALLERSRSRH